MRHRGGLLMLLVLCFACSPGWRATPAVPAPPALKPTIFDVEVPAPATQARLQDPRPNIIVVLTDDQPYQTVEYMPTIREVLMAKGVVFQNAFDTTPLCCPSRSSMLTGEYVHNHQVLTDRYPAGGARKLDDSSTFAVWAEEAGYRTAYLGKYLNDYESLEPIGYVPPGWDEWSVFFDKNLLASEEAGSAQFYLRFRMSENGSLVEYRSKANFSADILTMKAVQFIADARDDPFLLVVGYYNPHSPYMYANRHDQAFRRSTEWTPWRPPDFNESNIGDKPAYLSRLYPFSPLEIDTTYTRILRSLLAVDDGVASILSALDKADLRDKTVILYLTDNGLTVGDHGFGFSKNCPYEACLRTPFIVYAPGFIAPRVDDHLVVNLDLAPTIAELAGTSAPSTVDGTSLVALLENPTAAWRNDFLIEHWATEEGVGSIIPDFSGLRTDRWKYVEYATGERELYNLVVDPFELRNLALEPRYAPLLSTLSKRVRELRQE